MIKTKFLPYLSLILLTCGLLGADNLVDNGILASDQSDAPDLWVISGGDVDYRRTGGPEGLPCLTIKATDSFSLRQSGITLVPGEKYRLSATIKTQNFSCERGLFVVHNDGWRIDWGFKEFPASSDWTRIESEICLDESNIGLYGAAVALFKTQGEISFADIRLEALTETGKRESFSPLGSCKERFLVPLEPSLANIPNEQKTLPLFWGYPITGKTTCEVVLDKQKLPSLEFVSQIASIPLTQAAPGQHQVQARVLSETGEELGKCEFSFQIITPLPAAPEGKRLNSLVTELLNQTIDKGLDEFSFVQPRDGWIYFELNGNPTGELFLNSEKLALFPGPYGALEARRRLPRGMHQLSVRNSVGALLIVRSIPELFKYPTCFNSDVPGNGNYDWDFHQKYVLDACTSLNGAFLPEENRLEARDRNLEWFPNLGVSRDVETLSPAELIEKISRSDRFTDPAGCGVTMDELFFYRAASGLVNYAAALRGLPNPDGKAIYTWFVGNPAIPGLHHNFMSAAMNAGNDRGFMLFEAYCQPQPTEKDAAVFIENKILTMLRQMNKFIPGATSKTGVILGNFTQIPILSLDHRADVDYKYYLDMQMNFLATHPECRDLPVTGYWGCQYADEETLRWSFRLLRHYAIEGQTSMLSSQFGFHYRPELLKNPDFSEGLEHWSVSGEIETSSDTLFGKQGMGIWASGKRMSFAVFKGTETVKEPALQQTVSGLIPGKAYSLQFVTADLKDILENRINPRPLPISADLGSPELLPGRSFVHIDRRTKTSKTSHARINLHRIVFRAATPVLPITIRSAGKADEKLILAHIQLKPYFEN